MHYHAFMIGCGIYDYLTQSVIMPNSIALVTCMVKRFQRAKFGQRVPAIVVGLEVAPDVIVRSCWVVLPNLTASLYIGQAVLIGV